MAYIMAHSAILIQIALGILLVISEIMGLSNSPDSAKGFVDGLIKMIQSWAQPKL